MGDRHETVGMTLPPGAGAVKFLCDGMLERLGRFLRAAGYDTQIADPQEHDGALLARAIREDRLLLTCDRELAQRRAAAGRVVVLPSNGLDRTAQALTGVIPVDWLRAPFTRCLIDNQPVRPATADEYKDLPPRARAAARDDVFACPKCGRLYWPGSHVRRIRKRLHQWQDDARCAERTSE
jgi:uncharacterized protein with PIN domain